MRTLYFPGGMVALIVLLLGLSHSLQLASAGSLDTSVTSLRAVRKLLQSSSNVPASATPGQSSSVLIRRGFPLVQHLISLGVGIVVIGLAATVMCICCRRPRRSRAPAAAAPSPQVVLLRFDPQGGNVRRQESGLPPGLVTTFPTKEFRKASGSFDRECAVCLCEYEDGDLLRELPGCSHSFHSVCIDTWLHKHGTCPICRMHLAAPSNPDGLESTQEHPGEGTGEGGDALGGVDASRRVLFEALENYRAELARVEAEAVGHLAAAEGELERGFAPREGAIGSGNGVGRDEATVVAVLEGDRAGSLATEESLTSRESEASEGPRVELTRR